MHVCRLVFTGAGVLGPLSTEGTTRNVSSARSFGCESWSITMGLKGHVSVPSALYNADMGGGGQGTPNGINAPPCVLWQSCSSYLTHLQDDRIFSVHMLRCVTRAESGWH